MAAVKRKADLGAATGDSKKPKKDASLTSFFGPPKVSTSAQGAKGSLSSSPPEAASALSRFSKDEWVATLSNEQKKLLKLEIDTLDPSWLAHLKDDIKSPDFLSLKRFLQQEIDSGKKIFPPLDEVYSWSRHTPLNKVKAVIIGQDPYHNHNQAHGLCFSVRPPTPAPPSLKNMFTALKKDYPSFTPPPKNGGLLMPWAEQGVLLLNTCLTVRAHEANSHANRGWEAFTQKVIDTVAKVRTRGVVFLAWGSPAQKRTARISGSKHLVLKSVHPSPLSASRGFFDCGHFKKSNEWLQERYGGNGTINWSLNVHIPSKEPAAEEPVKVTEGQKIDPVKVDNPATKVPERLNGEPIRKQEEFAGEDDEDAIEALEALAQEGVEGDLKDTSIVTTATDAQNAVTGTDAEKDSEK